jgi:hypothetical protein
VTSAQRRVIIASTRWALVYPFPEKATMAVSGPVITSEKPPLAPSGQVTLNGLSYNALGERFQTERKRCVEWLRLQAGKPLSLQPYEQLSKVLKSSGYESEATEVLIAKQDDLRRHGDLKLSTKLLKGFLKYTMAYGYKPHLALRWVLLVVVIGTIFFQLGYDHGLMTKTKQSSNGRLSKNDYPQFHAFHLFR